MDKLEQGEINYFDKIKNECNIIFDVGSHYNSIFIKYNNIVTHYFEPYSEYYKKLVECLGDNHKSFTNNFGLSDETNNLPYFQHGAMFDRPNLPKELLGALPVTTGTEYLKDKNITKIDFLKIDVEGLEFKVLKGFGINLSMVKYIQFEYGIGLREAGSNLNEIVEYLKSFGFENFGVQRNTGVELLTNFNDTWEWCNIVCENKNLK